jgi:hypothetical protein
MKPTMKTTAQTTGNERSRTNCRPFPLTDYNYHSIALGGRGGQCARVLPPSLRDISREYFDTEANRYFLAEAFIFGSIMLTAAMPLVNGAQAVLHLVRVSGGF